METGQAECETCGSSQGEAFGAYVVCAPCQSKHWSHVRPASRLTRGDFQKKLDDEYYGTPKQIEWEARRGITRSGHLGRWFYEGVIVAREENAFEPWQEDDLEPLERLLEQEDGWEKAERIIAAWSRSPKQTAFLRALAVGHTQAEARRISGITVGSMQRLMERLRA